MSKRKKKQFRPAPPTRLDPLRAVPDHELDPCADAGKPHCPCVKGRTSLVLRGFDNKWRCETCHRVHIADVYRQSGEGEPETVAAAQQARPADPDLVRAMAERSARIGKQFRRGGEYYDIPIASGAGFALGPDSAKEAASMRREVPQAVGETNADYSDRLMAAYRAIKQRRSKP